MRLFTKSINQKLFKQYVKGANLDNQNVVAKVFNPYGAGRWYIMNSDPNDPDYMWGIVQMGNVVEVGSISRSELENYRTRFGLGLERDLHFSDTRASYVYQQLNQGKILKSGGKVDDDCGCNSYESGGVVGGLNVDEAIYLYVKKAITQMYRQKYLVPAGLWKTPKAEEVEKSLKQRGLLNSMGAINETGKKAANEVDAKVGQMISREYVSSTNLRQAYQNLVKRFESGETMASSNEL